MGSAMGQDPEILGTVCGWVKGAARVPVWAKMTPNITHIEEPARAALAGGCDGVSAINTILSVMNIDLKTLRPEPTVAGYSTAGGHSGRAIRPIAMRMVMECAKLVEREFAGRSLSAIGGVESGEDAAGYLLLGANTVQVCTGVMIHGYGLVRELVRGLEAFMDAHSFGTIDEFRGRSLGYFTTHSDLVVRQAASRREARASVETVVDEATWLASQGRGAEPSAAY
jgi:dihydroorotate dehydrogenase